MNETVTWRAKHLGIWQTLTTKITLFHYPHHFTDEMMQGAFRSMKHEHIFKFQDGKTLMEDVFLFQSPYGIVGKIFNTLYLTRYMTNLLIKRNEVIKRYAESLTV